MKITRFISVKMKDSLDEAFLVEQDSNFTFNIADEIHTCQIKYTKVKLKNIYDISFSLDNDTYLETSVNTKGEGLEVIKEVLLDRGFKIATSTIPVSTKNIEFDTLDQEQEFYTEDEMKEMLKNDILSSGKKVIEVSYNYREKIKKGEEKIEYYTKENNNSWRNTDVQATQGLLIEAYDELKEIKKRGLIQSLREIIGIYKLSLSKYSKKGRLGLLEKYYLREVQRLIGDKIRLLMIEGGEVEYSSQKKFKNHIIDGLDSKYREIGLYLIGEKRFTETDWNLFGANSVEILTGLDTLLGNVTIFEPQRKLSLWERAKGFFQ